MRPVSEWVAHLRARRPALEVGRTYTLTAVAFAALLASSQSAAASSPPKLSAEQIVARNVAARGGLEAWRKVQSMVWLGHIESAHASVPSMLFMLSQQRPNRMRFEINAMGDKTTRVFDGTHGWKQRPDHGRPEVQPYTTEELRFEQAGPGIDGVLIDYAAKGSSVDVKGIDEVGKGYAYHLILRTASGESQHVWVDAKTFLEIRYDRPAAAAGGSTRTVSVVYRDYRDTQGLKTPWVIETGAGSANTPDRMIIERVLVNPKLDEQTFSEPGARRRNLHASPASQAPPSNPVPAGTLPPDSSRTSNEDPGATPR